MQRDLNGDAQDLVLTGHNPDDHHEDQVALGRIYLYILLEGMGVSLATYVHDLLHEVRILSPGQRKNTSEN